MINNGLRAIVTCVDPKQVPEAFVGREYNKSFLEDIPVEVDPCGENGEFHSFAFEGPMFREPIKVSAAETVHRDGFVFSELLLDNE
jgi:diphthamide synthase (EF-2-diphthine--ammonia ligase)